MNHPPPLLVLKDRLGYKLLVILGTILVSGFCLMNAFGAAPLPTSTRLQYLGGLLSLMFVPLCFASTAWFISGKPRLSATQDGITLWRLASTIKIKWADIDVIETFAIPVRIGEIKFIRIKLRPSAPLSAKFTNWSRMRRFLLQNPLDGFHVATTGSGRKSIDVALELKQLRTRFS